MRSVHKACGRLSNTYLLEKYNIVSNQLNSFVLYDVTIKTVNRRAVVVVASRRSRAPGSNTGTLIMAGAASINWNDVRIQILQSVANVVHVAWTTAAPVVEAQLQGLVEAGQRIDAESASMKQAEYDDLKQSLSSDLQFKLLMTGAIGAVVAEQAAAAAWNALAYAIKDVYPAIGLVL